MCELHRCATDCLQKHQLSETGKSWEPQVVLPTKWTLKIEIALDLGNSDINLKPEVQLKTGLTNSMLSSKVILIYILLASDSSGPVLVAQDLHAGPARFLQCFKM